MYMPAFPLQILHRNKCVFTAQRDFIALISFEMHVT